MDAMDFKDLRLGILKKQGIKPATRWMDIDKITFKRKIAENDNVEKIGKIIESNRGKEILMIAGTGTGKTYTVNKYMDKLYAKEGNDHRIQLIGVPSTAQARQLEKDGFHVLVESAGIDDMDFLWKNYMRSKKTGHSSMKIVFVYDKAETVRKFLKRHTSYKADLFVDEAHKLYTAYNYRAEAIDIVEKLIREVKDRAGTVVLMTATPRSLAFRESIDRIICCKGAEKIAKYRQIEIVCKGEESQSFQDVVYSTIVKEVQAGNRCLIRYNSFADTGDISAKLRAVNNLNVKVVSSKNKDFEREVDTEGNHYNIYKNDIFNCFVNKSSLPEADCWFTTSMLDEGGSIEKIEKYGQTENLVAIFVVKDKRFMQIDDALQFSARIRFPYKKFIFIMNRTDEEEKREKGDETEKRTKRKISEMENLCWAVSKQVDTTMKIVQSYAEIMKLKSLSDSEIKQELIKFTQLENLAGFKNNMECIAVDSAAEVRINEKKRALVIYNTYNNQYADNVHALVELLKKENDCRNIIVTKAELIQADFDAKDYLEAVMDDKNLLLQIHCNCLSVDELKIIEHTKDYKKVRELINIQDVVYGARIKGEEKARKAVEAVCENKVAEFRKTLLKCLLAQVPKEEIREMYLQKSYEGKYRKEKELFSEMGIFRLLDGLNTMLGDLDRAVDKLRKYSDDLQKAEKYIRDNMDGYMNEVYLKDRDVLWGMDRIGRERTIILDNIYELNRNGKMKKKTINDELLEKVRDALNKEFGDDIYTKIKVANRIRKMCKFQDNGTKIYALKKIGY